MGLVCLPTFLMENQGQQKNTWVFDRLASNILLMQEIQLTTWDV